MRTRADSTDRTGANTATKQKKAKSGTATLVLLAQPTGDHDRLVNPPIPLKGRWVARHGVRTLVQVLLVLAAVGAALSVRAVVRDADSSRLIVLLGVVCAVVLLWGVLMVTRPLMATLDGSRLSVRHHGVTDVFDLADPGVPVTQNGAHGGAWSLELEGHGGRRIVLDGLRFPREELQPIFTYYQRVGRERMAARLERFHR